MLRVCALTNMIDGEYIEQVTALERSLYVKDVPFLLHLDNLAWNWNRRLLWELEVAQNHPDDDLVFIDALDFLFVGERCELEQIAGSHPLLFSCDCGPAPFPAKSLAPAYDAHRPRLTKWCWLNGCGPCGDAKVIAAAIKWGLDKFPPVNMTDTDQLFWSKVYLSGWGELDQFCLLHQPLYDPDVVPGHVSMDLGHKDGRIVNTITGTKPQFIHATAQSWAAIPKELIPGPVKRGCVRWYKNTTMKPEHVE